MRAAYKLWTGDMAASDKYRDAKPDWVWIDDPVEAEKVGSGLSISSSPLPDSLPDRLLLVLYHAAGLGEIVSSTKHRFPAYPARKPSRVGRRGRSTRTSSPRTSYALPLLLVRLNSSPGPQ